MGDIIAIVAINLVLAGVLALVWRFWARRRPVIAHRLARRVDTAPKSKVEHAPCEGVLSPCVVLAQATELGGSTEQLWVALLTRWVAMGAITIEHAPKRALHGFGADMQLQLQCVAGKGMLTGAEAQLYARLADHPEAKDGMQESLLYLWARDNAKSLTHDLSQLTTEGKTYLRAHGMSKLEEKSPWFGFAQPRELYTPRGIREAVLLRDTLEMPCTRDTDLWWLTQPNPPQTPIGTLAQQICQGMSVGGNR